MINPDWRKLSASIVRCNAVYETNDAQARAAFAAIGCKVIDRYSSPTAQAILHIAQDNILTLTIAGTRVSEGDISIRAHDVYQDAEEIFANHEMGGGAVVASGAYQRGCEIWEWVKNLVINSLLRIEGHSLGGQTTIAMACIVPPTIYSEGIAWEAPKAANDNWYAQYLPDQSRVTSVINGRDFWAAHPILSATLSHMAQILHLDGVNWKWISRDDLPIADAPGDHDTTAIIPIVAEIAQKTA